MIDQVVHMVAVTSLLPAYTSQDLRNCQLKDDLVGPFLRAKEAGTQLQSGQGGPSWRKMAQLWDQLLIKDGVLCRFLRM